MSKVLIVVNAEVQEGGKLVAASPATTKMVDALHQAIASTPSQVLKIEAIQVVSAASIWSKSIQWESQDSEWVYCPLTIQLPHFFQFPNHKSYQNCGEIDKLRYWVSKSLGFLTSNKEMGLGDLWLPIVLTPKGPLYGEVIGEGIMPNSYQQPVDLPDYLRQPLYRLGYQLLEFVEALPAVYLLQFGWQNKEIIFDRLWPFPAAPAVASIGVQQPDLLACHWSCLTNQPILDLTIMGIR